MKYSDLEHYQYELPKELIRQKPVEPRDSARLFVYDTVSDTLRFDVFRNLSKYLPPKSLLVLNNTKVIPARLWLCKETGGKIEVLVLANEMEEGANIPIIVDRKVIPGQKLFFPNGAFLEVIGQSANIFETKLTSKESIWELLDAFGTTPVPHYLEGENTPKESALRTRYQTVFAHAGASIAAPTASLHFTEHVFATLREKDIERQEITLNVGLGTFAPLTEEHFETRSLHTERVVISRETVTAFNRARAEERSIIAVGTTVTRTLEGFAIMGKPPEYCGSIQTFLYPPYVFEMVDILLTNFHLPKTSLLLLVDAFLLSKGANRRIQELYAIAIREGFSFYSFGDSMLIL